MLCILRELIRQASVLGNERGAQEVVFARLDELGLTPEMWDLDLEVLRAHPTFGPLDISYTGRPNVTAVWSAATPGGRSFVLNGHIDVVPPGLVGNWSHGPWEAFVEGDWLYGRGAADMKAGVAAMLLAVEALRAAGCQLRGDVILESVIEEECTGNGTLASYSGEVDDEVDTKGTGPRDHLLDSRDGAQETSSRAQTESPRGNGAHL